MRKTYTPTYSGHEKLGLNEEIMKFGLIYSLTNKILFSSFVPSSLRKYGKSPPPFGEGLNLQPDHLYTTYGSVVNFLCINILTSTKRKVNRTIH